MGLLYANQADVIRWLLVQLGKSSITLPSGLVIPVGLVTDPTLSPLQPWPCYADDEPDSPDCVVTVYDTQGRDDGRSMIDGERDEHLGFQIRIRASTKRIGVTKAQQIKSAIDQAVQAASVTPPGSPAHSYMIPAISRTSQVIYIGKETPATKRIVLTINAICPIAELV